MPLPVKKNQISVHPRIIFGYYKVSNPEIGNFSQGQGNQGIAQKGHLWMETNYYITHTMAI
ncbi:MAG: hypothetical protein A2V65_06630 [Deltaproteobacteria bacterium RBG_13_49_15]|nr:MAG: hypothetical protein A2V65_06630 [Deltaproteobacteria bacterium RBG_13_49_15]